LLLIPTKPTPSNIFVGLHFYLHFLLLMINDNDLTPYHYHHHDALLSHRHSRSCLLLLHQADILFVSV
jgi:hypothetical protein